MNGAIYEYSVYMAVNTSSTTNSQVGVVWPQAGLASRAVNSTCDVNCWITFAMQIALLLIKIDLSVDCNSFIS